MYSARYFVHERWGVFTRIGVLAVFAGAHAVTLVREFVCWNIRVFAGGSLVCLYARMYVCFCEEMRPRRWHNTYFIGKTNAPSFLL